MAPPSKSKEPKKEAMNRTARRKTTTKASNTKSVKPGAAKPNAATDGLKPEDAVEQLVKSAKNRAGQYDLLKAPMSFLYPDCVIPKFLPQNPRLPVPINDKRIALVGDDYLPSQLVSLESNDYLFVQAPTKAHVQTLWKYISKEQCKILVCMCHDDQMSASDDSKCYTYFPTEPNQQIEVEQKQKGKYTITCKSKEGLSMGGMKYELELSDSEAVVEKISDDPNAGKEPKALQLTVYHMNTWTGLRPESGNPLEQAESVANFLILVSEAEVAVLRQHMSNFVPPVILQSFDAVGRSSIAWVILMLIKDVAKRECFDVPDLIKKIMKVRPGSISNYYHYVFTYAVAMHIAKHAKWCDKECAAAFDDLVTKFSERKLNEVGNLVNP